MKKCIAILFLLAMVISQVHPAMDAMSGCKHTTIAKAKSCCATHHKPDSKKTDKDDCCKDDCTPFTGNCGKCGIDLADNTHSSLLLEIQEWKANVYYHSDASKLSGVSFDVAHPPEA
jgi:hypothetical protein